MNRANTNTDLPKPWNPKRIIVYASGLKIYGMIPYLLQMKLQAKFVSNQVAGLIFPTGENNFTVVRYRRQDGKPHSADTLRGLMAWLQADAGCEIGVADPIYFHDDMEHNILSEMPRVHAPTARTIPALLAAFDTGRASAKEIG